MIVNAMPPENIVLARLAREVRKFRADAGLTQLQLAELAGTSRSVIARLEAGVKPPTIATLTSISAALGVDLVLGLQDPRDSPLPRAEIKEAGEGRIRVLVADAQRLFAESLATALAQSPDLEVSFVQPKTPLTTGLEAAEAVIRSKPDVAVLDYWLTEMQGEALVRMVLGWRPDTKVLITSWFHGPRDIEAAVGAGALGFLPKTHAVGEIVQAIRDVHAGRTLLQAERDQELVQTIAGHEEDAKGLWERLITLTPREVDVIRMLATGQPTKQIAEAMEISQGTLRIHLNNIMTKTGVETRMEAVALARQAGLIQS